MKREDKILDNIHLVKKISSFMKYKFHSNIFFEEIMSAGYLGLINAVDKFDESKDAKLSTYAAIKIKGSILDYLRELDPFSRSSRGKIKSIANATDNIRIRERREPTPVEICKELNISNKEYQKTLFTLHNQIILSSDDFIAPDGETRFTDYFESDVDSSLCLEIKESGINIRKIMSKFKERDRNIIELYYFKGKNLKEIGSLLDLTESRICQIHKYLLKKLRFKLNGKQRRCQ